MNKKVFLEWFAFALDIISFIFLIIVILNNIFFGFFVMIPFLIFLSIRLWNSIKDSKRNNWKKNFTIALSLIVILLFSIDKTEMKFFHSEIGKKVIAHKDMLVENSCYEPYGMNKVSEFGKEGEKYNSNSYCFGCDCVNNGKERQFLEIKKGDTAIIKKVLFTSSGWSTKNIHVLGDFSNKEFEEKFIKKAESMDLSQVPSISRKVRHIYGDGIFGSESDFDSRGDVTEFEKKSEDELNERIEEGIKILMEREKIKSLSDLFEYISDKMISGWIFFVLLLIVYMFTYYRYRYYI